MSIVTNNLIADELPLLDLFTRLREAGLPLGVGEYQLLLRALQGGFGVADEAALKRLCQALWVKSTEDNYLFEYHFKQVMAQAPISQPVSTSNQSQPTDFLEDSSEESETEVDFDSSLTATSSPTTVSTPSPEFVMETDDEVQVAQAVKAEDIDNEITDRNFLLTSDYFPVTRRQMKQSWRYLRRSVREGLPVELDVEATVNQIGCQGVLLEPVLVPRRVNRAELMLLIDQDGSMVPFHALSRRLAETALRGGRLGKAGIYYFHNCPIDYLYHDPHHQEAEAISDILTRIPERTAVLIFSDAGAARGGYSEERIEWTEAFFEQLKAKVRYMAWLNPMPRDRWHGTTAGEIARLVPMFEVTRRGLQDAINELRGG
ncbi:MAG: hypothetical protein LDL41_10250 [Coleofasciculus sp. S288]|nr:hypothetical protein [Coleofasciculus sp. S288]